MSADLTPVLTDADVIQKRMHAKALDALKSIFPLDLKGRTLELEDVKLHHREYSPDEQKKALVSGVSLESSVKGTLVLKGPKGEELDRAPNFTLTHLPYLTERHTIVSNGNEYQVANQLRRKPGVYTQRADNGELKSVFNLGRGKNFDLAFKPEKGTFYLQYGTSNIPLYPLLREMGVPHERISLYLGEGVAKENRAEHGEQGESAVNKVYQKLVHPALYNPGLMRAEKVDLIQKEYARSTLDPEVTKHTLGVEHTHVTPNALLEASRRLLSVHNAKSDVDDTDSLTFKTFHSADDFIAERIRLTGRQWAKKAKLSLTNKQKIRDGLKPAPFSDSVRKFVTTSTLSAVPTGINPMELIDHAVKVTALGEGGIPSDRAIPFDARMVHPTQFGAIDPIRTVESFHSGVDIRASIAAHRDDKGNLYSLFHDVKSNKNVFVRAGDLNKYVVAFPHQELKGTVDALVNGQTRRVPASQVTHQMIHVSHQYSPATALLPLIHNMQGNRAIMASKMGTQALPLVHREVPLVQTKSHLPGGESFEAIFGHMIVPQARTSGTVAKIEDGWIHIRPGSDKKAEDEGPIKTKKLGPITFKIDRPKGFVKRWDSGREWTYPVDYGFFPKLTGEDDEGLDAFVGDDEDAKHESFLKLKRLDNGRLVPDETKFLIGVDAETKREIYKFYGDEVAGRTVYHDWDGLFEALKRFPGKIKARYSFEKTAAKGDENLVRVPYQQNFPFHSKTYLDHTLTVKPGDKVEAGKRLGDSNFTKDGVLALGKNLLVAYMPYHGYNSNDAVVISESCAKSLTSSHMYREVFPLNSTVEFSKDRHRVYFPGRYNAAQYGKLDSRGVVKVGSVLNPKDPIILGLTKTVLQGTDLMLGRISKTLASPYREVGLLWEHGTPGTVVEVHESPGQITVLVKTLEQMQIGDKLAGRHGNKGVVAKILPDHEMIKDAEGRTIDLLLSSAGVVSRINPSQVLETVLGKVAEKTGKPIIYDNALQHNAVKWVRDLAKEHGVKDKEPVYDPVTKRTITGADGKGVLVGRQYTYKLFKSTDTNFSGHGVGPYDVNEQPLKMGGDESAKGLGKMEFDSILAHDARYFLQEAATIKGQKNDAFWKAIQTGAPMPAPRPTFAFNKFLGMLEGSGIKVDRKGSTYRLLPMTDKDVMEKSNGPIANKKTLIAKNLKPEKGGLFDPVRTGGPQGTLYSHVELNEAIPNPVFMDATRRLLGLTEKDFIAKIGSGGGKWFKEELGRIDVDHKLAELRQKIVKAKGADLDNLVKQVKSLEALKRAGLKPVDAYVISKVGVVPPVFRPILPQPNDPSQLMVADANKLYAHLMDTNDVLKNTAVESDRAKHRQMVFHAVGAIFGTHDPMDEKLQKQEVKGFLQNIAGVGTPKGGFFQRKLMRRTQDVSGRGTIVPDPNLGMDEVGLPEQMLWQMYDKLVVARLVRKGYSALSAREMVTKKDHVAREALLLEIKERPVLLNRAPTLHRWSMMAAYPKIVQGKTIRMSPFMEKGMAADYDGDTLQVHAPIGPLAIEDAKQMTLSNMLLSDQGRNKLMAFPQHESIMGTTLATKAVGNGAVKHFKTREEVMSAYRHGELALTDQIQVDNEKKAYLDYDSDDE